MAELFVLVKRNDLSQVAWQSVIATVRELVEMEGGENVEAFAATPRTTAYGWTVDIDDELEPDLAGALGVTSKAMQVEINIFRYLVGTPNATV